MPGPLPRPRQRARAQDDAGGRRVPPAHAQGQAGHLVLPRLDLREIEPLDHDHPGPEQRVVGREVGGAEAVDRQVVEADQLDARLGEVVGRVLGEVDVVLLVARLEHLARHARLEQHPQVVAQVERLEVGPLDPLARQRAPRPAPCRAGSRGAAGRPSPPRPRSAPGASTCVPVWVVRTIRDRL